MRVTAALTIVLLSTASCGGEAARSIEHEHDQAIVVGKGEAPAAPTAMPMPAQPAAVTPWVRAEIREGTVRLRVGSADSAAARASALAVELGGTTARRDTRRGEGGPRASTLQLRIPADRFEIAMHRLADLGRLEHSTINTIDVGDQLVDLRARLENARRLESRLLELLRTRTGNLQNVLAVERELARVREEIERFEAQLALLQNRVAMSTIVADLFEPAPVVALAPAGAVIGESFRAAWRNFVALTAAVIASLGVVLPLSLVGMALVVAIRRWKRRRGTSAAPPPAGGELATGGILGD